MRSFFLEDAADLFLRESALSGPVTSKGGLVAAFVNAGG